MSCGEPADCANCPRVFPQLISEAYKKLEIERDALRKELAVNANMLAKQCDLARTAEAELTTVKFQLDNANKDRAGLAGAIKVHRIAEEALQRDLAIARDDLILSPSERCKKYQVQCCMFCEKLDCGDNTSDAKKDLAEAERSMGVLILERDRVKKESDENYEMWKQEYDLAHRLVLENDKYEKELAEAKKIIDWMIRVYDAATGGEELVSNQGQALDGFSELYNYRAIAKEAKEKISPSKGQLSESGVAPVIVVDKAVFDRAEKQITMLNLEIGQRDAELGRRDELINFIISEADCRREDCGIRGEVGAPDVPNCRKCYEKELADWKESEMREKHG